MFLGAIRISQNMFQMHDLFGVVAHKMPMQMVDPVEKMINKDVRYRPSAQLFSVVSMPVMIDNS